MNNIGGGDSSGNHVMTSGSLAALRAWKEQQRSVNTVQPVNKTTSDNQHVSSGACDRDNAGLSVFQRLREMREKQRKQ